MQYLASIGISVEDTWIKTYLNREKRCMCIREAFFNLLYSSFRNTCYIVDSNIATVESVATQCKCAEDT